MHGMMRLALLGVPGAQGGIIPYAERVMAVESADLIAAYLLDGDALDSTDNGCDGVPSASVTFTAPGIGDGRKMARFNGTDGVINILSTELTSLLDADEGTLLVWYRMPDPAPVGSGYLFSLRGRLEADTANFISFSAQNGSINFSRTVSGAVVSSGKVKGPGIYCLALKWSVVENAMRLYIDGFFVTEISCAAWPAGYDFTRAALGAHQGESRFLNGDMGHAYLWAKPLKDSDILDLSTVKAVERSFYPVLHNPDEYDAFGVALVFGSDVGLFTRQGTGHYMENGKIIKITPDSSSREWEKTDFYDTVDRDDRNVAGGVASSGTGVLFWALHDYSGAAPGIFTDIVFSRSIDSGVTWSAPASVSPPDTDWYSPYGPLVELPSGALLQTFYGTTSDVRRFYTLKSSDDGASWGSEVVIASGKDAGSELAACYLDGETDGTSRLIAVARHPGAITGQLHCYNSNDGGATWAYIGNLPFSSGADTDVSPWLYNDNGTIHLIYADRTTMQIKHATGQPNDIFDDVNGWTGPNVIYSSDSTNVGAFGYPSIVKVDGVLYLTFNDSPIDPGDPCMFWGKLTE